MSYELIEVIDAVEKTGCTEAVLLRRRQNFFLTQSSKTLKFLQLLVSGRLCLAPLFSVLLW